MEKTRVGITAGAFGAAACLAGFFGGYVAVILLAGYVLLFEENAWLRRCVVKVFVIMLFFSFVVEIINLIPDVLGIVINIVTIFGISFDISIVSNIFSCITSVILLIEKILMLGLGIKAIRQETIVIHFFDSLVSEYMKW